MSATYPSISPDIQDAFTMRWYGSDQTYYIYDKFNHTWFYTGGIIDEYLVPEEILEGKEMFVDYDEYEPLLAYATVPF